MSVIKLMVAISLKPQQLLLGDMDNLYCWAHANHKLHIVTKWYKIPTSSSSHII